MGKDFPASTAFRSEADYEISKTTMTPDETHGHNGEKLWRAQDTPTPRKGRGDPKMIRILSQRDTQDRGDETEGCAGIP